MNIDLAAILALFTAEPNFAGSLSGNQTTLLNQLKNETKKVSDLSDRDQGTFRALQTKFTEWTEAVAAAEADAVITDAPVIQVGTVVYHSGRKVFGEVDDIDGKLMVRYIDENGRKMKMALSDKWEAASEESADLYREAIKPSSADPNDMVDISAGSGSVAGMAIEKIDQAIDGEIIEQVDVLEIIGPDEDLSGMKKLSAKEIADLEVLETQIKTELPNWEKSNDLLGSALSEINTRKLFRNSHRSFVKYVFDTFGVTRAKAYQLMITAEVKAAITGDGSDQVEALPSQRAAQTLNQITQEVKSLLADNHSQTEIANYDRMLHKYLWEITLRSAPRSADGKPIISPGHLESVKETISQIVRSGNIEVDGEDVPISGLSTFVDHNITQETRERNLRMQTEIVDKVQKNKERKSEPQERVSVSSKDGKKLKNTVQIICSEHGESHPKKFVFGGMVLGCGCAFVKVAGKDALVHTDIIE